MMKKVLVLLLIVCMIFPTVYGLTTFGGKKFSTSYDLSYKHATISGLTFYVKDVSKEYCRVESKDIHSYLMKPGRPILPKIVKTFEIPFGATNIEIKVTPLEISQQTIKKQIQPCPAPMPLLNVKSFAKKYKMVSTRDNQVYQSKNPYPSDWYHYNIGVGVNEDFEHVTFVTVHFYPLRYIPAENRIIYAEKADVNISYTPPEENLFSTTSTYDLVVIAPSKFEDALQPLIDHKNNHGVKTVLKTTEEIYDEYPGVDKPERIKYFIKDALEQWNIKYVLLVGGLKSKVYGRPRDNKNCGSRDWYVPVRYSNLRVNGDPGYPTDLYYADVYKIGGEFESWDSDGDGVFAEWPDDKPEDVMDLYPDVAVGRLAARSVQEVEDVVNKIITYETAAYGEEWFKKIKVVSGDGFLDQMDLNIQWDTKPLPDGKYTIYAQSFNPEGESGPMDIINITLDRSKETSLSFNHDDYLRIHSFPGPPMAEIVSVSEGDILGNTDYTYTPSEGEAYCNSFNPWANISYINGVLTIRGKSYDPKPYGNVSSIHVWVTNENGEIVFSDWRNNTEMYYEGEWVTGEKMLNGRGGALYYMPNEFKTEKLWTSNGKFTGQDDVISAISDGCGFLFMSGHGSPNVWADHYPGVPGNRQHASVVGLKVINFKWTIPFFDLPPFPMDTLSNGEKLPVAVVGGCHNSQFNVSAIPATFDVFNLLFKIVPKKTLWAYSPVPECFSWRLIRNPKGGAIASIGNTGLGYGMPGKVCTVGGGDSWITIEFFKKYGAEGYHILGQAYTQTLISYLDNFDMTDLEAGHPKTLHEWVLLGDPTLKIGGYS